jgi:arsenite-transporting ATPase
VTSVHHHPRPEATILTRALLFTGKGGVGKTSLAAATAAAVAAEGGRVLVTSTDPAHSLADALDQPLGDRPTPVPVPPGRGGTTGRLDAQQLDAQARLEHHWREVRDYLVALLAWGGAGHVQAEELVLLPGLDEVFALLDLRRRLAAGRYDLVVVDCAPTAETLKLLALPDTVRWYRDTLLAPGRRLARTLRPLTRARGADAVPLPVPDDAVFDAVERLHDELTEVHELLRDPQRATVRLVVAPERLGVAEAQRTATSLGLFGYGIDAVLVNRILPDAVADPYLQRWKARHAEHLDTIRGAFAPVPVLTAPLLDDEPIGPSALARLGAALYDGRDPAATFHAARTLTVDREGDLDVLRVPLPFATDDDLDLHRRGADLHLKVAGVKRTVPLPAALARAKVVRARLHDQVLEVAFETAVPTRTPVGSAVAGGPRP